MADDPSEGSDIEAEYSSVWKYRWTSPGLSW